MAGPPKLGHAGGTIICALLAGALPSGALLIVGLAIPGTKAGAGECKRLAAGIVWGTRAVVLGFGSGAAAAENESMAGCWGYKLGACAPIAGGGAGPATIGGGGGAPMLCNPGGGGAAMALPTQECSHQQTGLAAASHAPLNVHAKLHGVQHAVRN